MKRDTNRHAYESLANARQVLDRYFAFYYSRRPHSSFYEHTPDKLYFESLPANRRGVNSLIDKK